LNRIYIKRKIIIIISLEVTLSDRTFASSDECNVSTKKNKTNIVKRKSEKERREKKGIIDDTMLSYTHTIECVDPYIIIAEAIIK